MDYGELIQGAMSIPKMIQPENKVLAAAHKLRIRAGFPNADGAVGLCKRIISDAEEMLAAGEWDPLFGGWSEPTAIALELFEKLPEGVPETEARKACEMLVTAVQFYVDTNDPVLDA